MQWSTNMSMPRQLSVRKHGSKTLRVCALMTQNSKVVPFKKEAKHLEEWGPKSWRSRTTQQQPAYPDAEDLNNVIAEIATFPPLVFAGECRVLQERLAKATTGDAFILMGGDCAEAFKQFNANKVRDTYRLLLQMAVVLMFGGGVPVVKMGRMAGQFAKPRSNPMEKKGDVELPSYKGDIINGMEFTPEARIPDPQRLIRAYNQSAATLNLLRGFSTGGYAGLSRVCEWNLEFMDNTQEGNEYKELAARVDEALQFMSACGLHPDSSIMQETEFYTAHEALLMDYEEALTRVDSTSGLWYDCSAHFVWCGERTRQLDGGHVEFFRGVANPIGVKVSHKMDPQELVAMIRKLNPDNVPGRLNIITRMGAENLRASLGGLVMAVQEAGLVVTWICDAVHGNTESVGGFKTRRFENVKAEIEAFFDVHEALGTVPGGVHLEMTGEDVTECIGGGSAIREGQLGDRYHTYCDPRLNAEQALEIAFYVAQRLRNRRMQSVKQRSQEKSSVASNGTQPSL